VSACELFPYWHRACVSVYAQPIFNMTHGLFLYVIVMTLGEFELNDVILDKPFAPFDFDVRLLLGALMFLMTIVVMNLTVR